MSIDTHDDVAGVFPQYYHGKVCVIMPCYNRNEFLRHSLPAWFSQTYKRFELVIVDYNSDDSVLADIKPIAARYKKTIDIDPPLTEKRYTNYSGITLLHVKDTHGWNMSHALNYAICRTTSEVVTICGCDTTPEPTYLELVMQIVNEKRVASVYCGRLTFPRHAWHHINGYNEFCEGWGWEDCDFRIRLKRAGYTIQEVDVMLCPSVTHMHARGDIGVTDKENRRKCDYYLSNHGVIGNYCNIPGRESPILFSDNKTNSICWATVSDNIPPQTLLATSICYTGIKNDKVYFIYPENGPPDIAFSNIVKDKIIGPENRRIVRQGVYDIINDIEDGVFQW